MKKLIMFLIVMLAACTCSAFGVTTQTRIEFMGIKWGSHVSESVTILRKAGFDNFTQYESGYSCDGFLMSEKVHVDVLTLNDKTEKIIIQYEACSNVRKAYFVIKDVNDKHVILREKYGDSYASTRLFRAPHNPNDGLFDLGIRNKKIVIFDIWYDIYGSLMSVSIDEDIIGTKITYESGGWDPHIKPSTKRKN